VPVAGVPVAGVPVAGTLVAGHPPSTGLEGGGHRGVVGGVVVADAPAGSSCRCVWVCRGLGRGGPGVEATSSALGPAVASAPVRYSAAAAAALGTRIAATDATAVNHMRAATTGKPTIRIRRIQQTHVFMLIRMGPR
jgi:hypothetical protein